MTIYTCDTCKRTSEIVRLNEVCPFCIAESAVATYQTEYEQKHIASAVELARKEERERVMSIVRAVEIKGERVGSFLLGDKVLDFANKLLGEFKQKVEQALTPNQEHV